MPRRFCEHGILASICPACTEEEYAAYVASLLHLGDPERLTAARDFDAWLEAFEAGRESYNHPGELAYREAVRHYVGGGTDELPELPDLDIASTYRGGRS